MAPVQPALEARLMLRPAATCRGLSSFDTTHTRSIWLRQFRLGLAIACFVSFTTTGRLSSRMVADGLVCWSFLPLLNLGLVSAVAACVSRDRLAGAIDSYLAASGPWLVWLLGFAGLAVWSPPTQHEVLSFQTESLFAGAAMAGLWSSWIQFRCLTLVWRLRPIVGLALLAGMKLVVWGTIVVFFFATDQLEPRL